MTGRNSKIVAIAVLLIIFIFGAGTVLKCKGDMLKSLQADSFAEGKTMVENSIQNNIKSKNNWINLNGLFQRAVGTTLVKDPGGTDVYRLHNGQLMYNLPRQDMTSRADELELLYKHTNKNGVDFMYVQYPFKIESDDEMPFGSVENANDNANDLLFMLEERNVPAFDIREEINKAGYEYDELFFNTDHHWKPDTALWAAGLIAAEMEKSYHLGISQEDIDFFYDIDNYDIKTYDDWFLGSLGKRTGEWYGGVDDFDVITPKFATDYDFYAKSASGDLVREGDFSDVMFRWDFINKKNLFGVNTYAGYLGGDYKVTKIVNNNCKNDLKVLILKDSYSNAMLPYLSMTVKDITALDLRHYEDMSAFENISANDYDLVVVAYNPSAFSDIQFDFDKAEK